MFGLKKPHFKADKHNKVDTQSSVPTGTNPFDYGKEFDNKQTLKPSRKTSSEPNLTIPNSLTNPFDDYEDERETPSRSSYSLTSAARNKYRNDFRDSGGLENQSVQELENYAVYKAEDTTKTVNGCLKIAEEIRGDATKTLITLHQQGEQITRTHNVTVEMDHDLRRGEKLLGDLGGMFSRTWKPKKTRPIKGPRPTFSEDNLSKTRDSHLEQREKLGLNPVPKGRANTHLPHPEPTNALEKVEIEKKKQDDGLTDLSNLLGELKDMAIDMGSEIERQTKALEPLEDDTDVLTFRVNGANQRGRRLIGK